MRARRLVLVTPLALLATAVFCPPISAGPWLPAPGEYYSEFRATQTSIRSAYDDEGTRTTGLGGAKFEERSLLSRSELGWKSWMSVVLGLPAKSVTFSADSPAFSSSATGLEDFEFGIKIKLKGGPTALALEGSWQAPLGYQRDVNPSLGAGVQQLVGRLSIGSGLPGNRGFMQLAGGYRYYGEDFQDRGVFAVAGDAMEGQADVGVWLGSSLMLAGHYETSFGLGDDPRPSTHVVGPEVRFRVDERIDVFAGSRHTAAGKNAFHQDGVYVGLAARHSSLNRVQGFLGGTRRP
jgi:hypothetical protein